jgi:hypothetical protein
MNIEMVKLYLKKLTENTGNLYSFKIFSDGSGSLATIRDDDVLSWDDEEDMYQVLLSMCVPSHCAKETLLNFLGGTE